MAKKKEYNAYKEIVSNPVGSTEWMNAFDRLPAQDQAQIYNFGMNDPTEGGAGFQEFDEGTADAQGNFQPALQGTSFRMPTPYGQMADIPQIDPTSQALLQFRGGVNIPQYTSSGKLDPFDLGQAQAQQNLYKSQVAAMMDLGMAAQAGPGAIDPSVFKPVVTMPTEQLATPGLDLLSSYAGGGGYRGFLAKKMLTEHMTDDEALGALWDLVNRPDDPNMDPAKKAQRDALRASLPSNPYQQQQGIQQMAAQIVANQAGGTLTGGGLTPEQQAAQKTPGALAVPSYDTARVVQEAFDLYKGAREDLAKEKAGWQDPTTGTWYTEAPTEEESAATERFHNAGLPTPVETYMDPKWIDMYADTYGSGGKTLGQYRTATNTANAAFNAAQKGALNTDLEDQAFRQAYAPFQEQRQRDAAADLRGQIMALPEYRPDYDRPENAAQQLTSQLSQLPENQGNQMPTPGQWTRENTAPGINLGGRITGTSLGDYMGRVAISQPEVIVPEMLTTTQTRDTSGQKDEDVGDLQRQSGGPGGSKMAPPSSRNKQGYALPGKYGSFTFYKTKEEAEKHLLPDDVANRARSFLNWGGSAPKTTPTYVTEKQLRESDTARRAADRRFVQANTQRFQNYTRSAPQSSANLMEAIFRADMAKTTPFQDAWMQRMLGQRAVGLR